MGIDEDYTIKDIDQNESDWIQLQLNKLRAYLEKQIGKKLDDIPDPTFLDEYFQTALTDIHSGQLEADDCINMFGVGLGQYLEEKSNFRWVIYVDKYGVDLALQNKTTKVIGFPLSSTAKRITNNYAGNFEAIFTLLIQGKNKDRATTLINRKNESQLSAKVSWWKFW